MAASGRPCLTVNVRNWPSRYCVRPLEVPIHRTPSLAAANDGVLWIGTSNGLTQYREGQFRTFTVKQGLPDAAITALLAARDGALWVVAGIYLSRYQDGRFTTFSPNIDIPVSSVRAVCEDANHDLWVAGFSRVVRRTGGKFVTAIQADVLDGMVMLTIMADRGGNRSEERRVGKEG